MVSCICGEAILAAVGDGFVVTLDSQRRWMRRRTDFYPCPICGRRHQLAELADLSPSFTSSQTTGW